MTDGIPIWGPISLNTGETLKLAKSGAIKVGPYLAAGIAIANFDEIEAILENLLVDVARTLTSTSQEEFCAALRAWGRDLTHLAEVMLGPVVAAGTDVSQTLAAEVLRSQFPRLAAMLTLAGAIVDDPGFGSHIDWEKLRAFMLVTPELVTEEFWDEAFGPGDSGSRMVALLAALVTVAPEAIRALNTGDLRIAPLPPPPTAPSASAAWKSLRTNSAGWVPVTFPLRTGLDGRLEISSFPDLRGGFVPELAISLLFRSQRRQAGGRTVTDFEFWVHPSKDAAAHELRTSSDTIARLEPGVRVGLGYDGGAGTWNAAIEPRDGSPIPTATNEATLRFGRDAGDDRPDIIIGPPFDTRLVVRDVNAELRFRESGEPSVELVARLDDFGVVVTNRWFRSLGETVGSLADGLRFDIDLEARLAEGTGFTFQADGALAVRLNLGKELTLKVLRIKVHSILIQVPVRADQDHFDIRAEVRPHWSATVGPATLVMDGAGAWIGWWSNEPGGSKSCIGLLPPTGVGLLLEFPGVAGGGFLDFTGGPNDRYGGVLTLRIGQTTGLYRFTATAFGIHELIGPPTATDRDRAFVLVIGTSFRPGWHIAYGIFLIGVGGIIGFNRRADTDALRQRLTNGAVGNLLFAEDPVRNAPVLLGDLATLFPPKAGYYVFGLTLQLGWVPLANEYLVRLAIGVILEIDGDSVSKAVLLGSLVVTIPGKEKFLNIQVDAIGVIDFNRHTLEIDSTIRSGRVMGLFKITGDGGMRSSWGDPPYMLATLGGFHPDFHPEPAVFPKLKRILITVDEDDLPDGVELSAGAYLAITSNTIQFGAEFTASIKAGNWKITGQIGGDALIRLPFYFDVSIRGKVGVTYRGHNIVSVKFKGGLAGPSPLVLRGEVCVSLLLFDACWSDSFTLGDSGALPRPVVASLVPVLAGEMSLAANLSVVDADDGLVLIARHDESPRVVLSPLGVVTWTQSRVPFGLEIELFEDGRLDEPQTVEVHASVPTTPFLDWFSPGSFLELSEAETLALPAFERHPSGLTVSPAGPPRSAGVNVTVAYDEIRVPSPPQRVGGIVIPAHVLERLQSVDAPPSIRPGPPRFGVSEDRFGVTAGAGPVTADLTAVAAYVGRRGSGAVSQHVADRRVTVST